MDILVDLLICVVIYAVIRGAIAYRESPNPNLRWKRIARLYPKKSYDLSDSKED